MADATRIRILGFETKLRVKNPKGDPSYELDAQGKPKTGELRYEDWVTYCPTGKQQWVVTSSPIKRLMKVTDANPENPAYAAAYARWKAIEPAYNAWKKGQELPEEGTPLAAFNLLRREDQDALRAGGVRTVEELSSMTDGQRDSFRIPRMRELIKQAQVFLAAEDRNKAQLEIQARDTRIEALEAEMKSMREQFAKGPQPQPLPIVPGDETAVAKRGPGRPAKDLVNVHGQ